MKKVYIVTSGEYSDYGIRAVFATKKAADAYVAARSASDAWDTASVEEWDLNTEKTRLLTWHAQVTQNISTGSTEDRVWWCDAREQDFLFYHRKQDGGIYVFNALGYTPDHARKNAYDFRARKLAELAGITDA